ncbi:MULTISPECIES: EAL domain-containing protein [unclassified Thioalkalivibrio]|uniref:EAL domain-containing protein n=1 Tax=unclassified Thioalkalivibrio TaxID=2621013 RepID=UPI00036B4B98|nr:MULTISPECIES: EAL domain-containing protein [unclassified Thioalkalivibrio]
MLVVRIQGGRAPRDWTRWGHPLSPESPQIWCFPLPDRMDLADLVEAIVLETPEERLEDCLGLWSTGDPAAGLSLASLDQLEPLAVMHARLHEPWILGPLAGVVESHFQPIVDLARQGEVYGYEMLCRARHPERGLLGGAETFALARRARCLDDLEQACQIRALARKAEMLPAGTPIFINALPQSLLGTDLHRHPSLSCLRRLGVAPEDVVIEIVESDHVEDIDAMSAACDTLRGLGFRIALDDLGTGYNGLALLASLRPDFIKLDRGLVHEAHGSRVRSVMLETLIAMARRLGCATVAEGLESERDLELCRDLGVHFAQGFLIGHPASVPVEPAPLPPRPEAGNPAGEAGEMRLMDYVTRVPTLPIEADRARVREMFRCHGDMGHLLVVGEGRPLGFIARDRFLREPPSRDHAGIGRLVRPLCNVLRGHVPVRQILWRLFHCREVHDPWVVVDDHGQLTGVIQPWQLLEQALKQGTDEGSHPLTGLSTGPALRGLLEKRRLAGQPQALLYIDLDNFKAFNDRYGFVRGDAMIKLLAECLRAAFGDHGECDLGHIGGDDFMVAGPAAAEVWLNRLHELALSFDQLCGHLYDRQDLERGFFTGDDGSCFPVANLSAVVVLPAPDAGMDSVALSERAAALKKEAKCHSGSVIVLDGDPPRCLPVEPVRDGDDDSWQEQAVAALERVARGPRGQGGHDLDAWFREHPYFELVYELDGQGHQRYANWVNPEMRGRIQTGGMGVDRSTRTYFHETVGRGQPFVSDIYLSSASEDFCVTLAIPLPDAAGALVGDINLAGLLALRSRTRSAGARAPALV